MKKRAIFFFGVVLLLWGTVLSHVAIGEEKMPRGLFSFVDLVKREKVAVVNISRGEESGRSFGRGGSSGSGFLITKEGLILTNEHVVAGVEKVQVRLSDEREFEGQVIGRDSKTDIALIKIAGASGLPFARFGDSDELEVGEWVVAIGNPFGLEQTVTVGIVSAKGRVIGSGPYDDFIQTDASINPGNSGGPLFNSKGEVIGVNTMINPQGQGIGFAIPINLIRKIIPQLEKEGKVTRGWLGVLIREPTKEQIESLGIKKGEGVFIQEVVEKSPAEEAGLRSGEVILEFDGRRIGRLRDLTSHVADTQVGKEVTVRVLSQKGKERFARVRIGKMEEEVEVKQR